MSTEDHEIDALLRAAAEESRAHAAAAVRDGRLSPEEADRKSVV